MRVMMLSAFFATLTMERTRIIHKKVSRPLGTAESTDKSILRKITWLTISTHMEPYIRHQPVKMSDVLLLPPTPKASGAAIVSTPRITYRSATSTSSLNTWNMMMILKIMINSQKTERLPKTLLSTRCTSTALGTSIACMSMEVISRQRSQIWGLARRRNEKTKERVNSSLGSSPSKPSPTTILLMA